MAPLVSSLGIADSHPDGKPANGGHGRLFWHGPASPSLAWPRCALGGALMKLPSSPTPAAACAMQPSSLTRLARPCLAALTCFEFHRGPGPERVGPQATLLHPPCTNPMASPLWVDGRWMGDLKEPAGGKRGERHHCCRLLLSTPLCPLVALALLCSCPLHSYPYLYSPLTSLLLLASWLVCLGAGNIGLLPNSSRLSFH